MSAIKCFTCGACCTVFDISTLGKPAGVSCGWLGANRECTAYDDRPEVCRAFKPDALCVLISTLAPEERAAVLTQVYYGR